MQTSIFETKKLQNHQLVHFLKEFSTSYESIYLKMNFLLFFGHFPFTLGCTQYTH
jgi:hypothetical protein